MSDDFRKYRALLAELEDAQAAVGESLAQSWLMGRCKQAAAHIRELLFLIETDREHAALSQDAAYANGAASVYAFLSKGFDVLDEDGEEVAFHARYMFEGGDRSVGIGDAWWFEVVRRGSAE